jgi:hypothetical protein
MIINHRSMNTQRIEHGERTVRDFIDNIIIKTHSKENKYFHICIYPYINGLGNLIMYFQDGILKSHHDTMRKFDYKEVVDCEILKWYNLGCLCIQDIHSIDCDNLEEFEAELNRKEPDYTVKCSENLMEIFNRHAHEERIRNKINKSDVSYEDLVECVKQLGKDLKKSEERNRELERGFRKLKEKNEILTQKMKWVGKNI